MCLSYALVFSAWLGLTHSWLTHLQLIRLDPLAHLLSLDWLAHPLFGQGPLAAVWLLRTSFVYKVSGILLTAPLPLPSSPTPPGPSTLMFSALASSSPACSLSVSPALLSNSKSFCIMKILQASAGLLGGIVGPASCLGLRRQERWSSKGEFSHHERVSRVSYEENYNLLWVGIF